MTAFRNSRALPAWPFVVALPRSFFSPLAHSETAAWQLQWNVEFTVPTAAGSACLSHQPSTSHADLGPGL
jgi:hypothetical protein